jgi:predicted transcriptional regulator
MAAQENSASDSPNRLRLDEEDLARIEAGMEAADKGDFASEEEVRAEFARWRELGQRNRREK